MLVRVAPRTLAVLVFVFAACGGLVQPQSDADRAMGPVEAGPPTSPRTPSEDASVDASLAADAPLSVVPDAEALVDADASGPPAWCAGWWSAQQALTAIAFRGDRDASFSTAQSVAPGVWVVGGIGADPWGPLIAFFRNLDVNCCAAGLPSAQDCNVCGQAATCTYDVTDPGQVQQNVDDGRFIGPDGNEWIWAYLPNVNAIVIVKQGVSPTDFDLAVFFNQIVLSSYDGPPFNGVGCVPECGCEPG